MKIIQLDCVPRSLHNFSKLNLERLHSCKIKLDIHKVQNKLHYYILSNSLAKRGPFVRQDPKIKKTMHMERVFPKET